MCHQRFRSDAATTEKEAVAASLCRGVFDEFDVAGDPAVGTKIEYLLGLGDPANQGSSQLPGQTPIGVSEVGDD
jgi:hypothetical protein